MELFKNFGFQPEFFVAQIINFLILAFVFKKFLYKPMLKVLRDRQKKIIKGIEDAQNAHIALEEAQQKRDELLKKTASEAEKILDDTKKASEKMREDFLSKSQTEAAKIIQDAKREIVSEKEQLEKQAKEMSLELSEKVLEKVIEELFTKEEKERILKRNIARIQKA